jgi:hypothetical protein
MFRNIVRGSFASMAMIALTSEAAGMSPLLFSCYPSGGFDMPQFQTGVIVTKAELKRADLTVPFSYEKGTYWIYQGKEPGSKNTWFMFDFVIHRLTGEIHSKEVDQIYRIDETCKKIRR